MKFRWKLALSILMLLALCLSLNGYLMIEGNFRDALETVTAQNAQRHNQDARQLEQQIAQSVYASFSQYPPDYDSLDYARSRELGRALQSAADALAHRPGQGGFSIRQLDGSPVFIAMPDAITQNTQIAALSLGSDKYALAQTRDGRVYMLMSAPLLVVSRDLSLISAFDVSALFASQAMQARRLLVLTVATMLAAALLVAALSGLLTRPLSKLKTASTRIAAGNYAERTQLCSGDEFGTLSASFDEMAAAVEANIRALEEQIREREDFVGAFTHELKTPMTSMLGYAALLRAEDMEPGQRRAAADYIWRETNRLEALSQKLMLLMGLKEETVELAPVSLRAAFSGVRRTLPKPAREVRVRFADTGKLRVMADRTLLDDLLRNLIVNAQRACADGGLVEIGCEMTEGGAVISVRDNGCGIPERDIARLTEPFYMVDKSRARAENGSGLGLALSERIAALHGTHLRFESEVGVGTVVRFTLATETEETPHEI